jgi:hypothetical protein
MKPIFYFILFSFLVISCIDENEQKPQTRLIRKILVESPVSAQKMVWEYHYDLSGRLDKITSGDWFEEKYIYDKFDQIINKKIYNYANDELGWVVVDSVVYTYANGKLTEEFRYNGLNEFNQHVKYEYENSKLTKKTSYFTESEYSIIYYEYSGQLCFKETMGSGSKDTDFIAHYYSEGKLQLSERYYIRYDGSNNLLQQIIYTYNEKGDLVLEEAVQIEQELVANLNYILMFEYEEFYK